MANSSYIHGCTRIPLSECIHLSSQNLWIRTKKMSPCFCSCKFIDLFIKLSCLTLQPPSICGSIVCWTKSILPCHLLPRVTFNMMWNSMLLSWYLDKTNSSPHPKHHSLATGGLGNFGYIIPYTLQALLLERPFLMLIMRIIRHLMLILLNRSVAPGVGFHRGRGSRAPWRCGEFSAFLCRWWSWRPSPWGSADHGEHFLLLLPQERGRCLPWVVDRAYQRLPRWHNVVQPLRCDLACNLGSHATPIFQSPEPTSFDDSNYTNQL